MSKYKFDAVIFDLDGVITKTALVHSAAWKKMFDDYLKDRAAKLNEDFVEFSHEKDYLPYVDGKPRYKGVESFLKSRKIELPFGYPNDEPGKETVCGLGNRKNEAFNQVLDRDGVEEYSSTVELIHKLKSEGIRVGVASSSKNCKAVLEKAGLIELIETRVDGVVSAELGLQGKPEADIFTTAADNLDVTYDKAVVVEDAVSGVQAGAKGNFGLVLGVARENNTKELKTNGADIVVEDISEIGFEGIVDWFEQGIEKDSWEISYSDYVPEKEKVRETLLTVGNGYIGTRGAMEEMPACKFNYPGSYMAGLYNRLKSRVGDREIENEDFVNFANWLPVRFKIGDGNWIDMNEVEILGISRYMNFRAGLLTKDLTIRDDKGNETFIESERFASMDNMHLAGMRYKITALNYNDTITIQSELDGDIINDGVARYRDLKQDHLSPVEEGNADGVDFVVVKTKYFETEVAVASTVKFYENENEVTINTKKYTAKSKAGTEAEFTFEVGKSITLEKMVAVYSSQEWDSDQPKADAIAAVGDFEYFDSVLSKSETAWQSIWQKIDIKLEGDRLAQKLLRMHLYHMVISLSPNNADIDASITARGLHGEAYRGHIFWDELFILPFYNLHFKEVAKSALMYRYRRLDQARKYAREYGYQGAMFPWQSGSDGREETQVVHLNPLTGKWGPDFSSFQRHVSLAIAYNVWQYFHASNDVKFIVENGAEMLFEICRFWASKSRLNKETGKYSIKHVMGPDEFHEKYPGSEDGGLDDNTYTNLMVVWAFGKAFEMLDIVDDKQRETILNKIKLTPEELKNWLHISENMNIVIEEDILAQYDGYFKLEELDWDYYREKYGNIYRMDRLLKAEGKSADDYKVAKQADTLQTFYNLDEKVVTGILNKLGYHLSEDYLAKNLEYYLKRTSHGSTLSRVVHAQLANMIEDHNLSWDLYKNALTSDFADVQGGTTGEGIHAGVMAGTILIALQSYAGLDLKTDLVKFNPRLPKHWRTIKFRFNFKQVNYFVELSKTEISILAESDDKTEVVIEIQANSQKLNTGKKKSFQLKN